MSGPYNEVFSWECIWCAKVPKRVSFFLWTAVRDGILTIDNLWSAIFEVFGIHWVMPKTVSSLLFAWRNWFGKHLSIIWNMVPACLIWLVWTERNTCIFEDNERTLNLLKPLLFGTLFQWAHVWGFTNCISISNFLHSIRLSF